MAHVRSVAQIVTGHHQREGGGFVVRRPFPTQGVQHLDPFLLLDEMGPVDYAPGQALGAPDHPHRGFETVTYVLEGEVEHADSAGHSGTLGPGDVQWMTAGDGVVHREMPSKRVQREGGRGHGFQLWVNLPREHKRTAPRYQELKAEAIPEVTTDDGLATVRVIAGSALGVEAVAKTLTPVTYQHWTLSAGADVEVGVDPEHRVAVYVFDGTATVGEQTLQPGQLAILAEGDAVRLRADGEAQLLLLGGRPLGEPIAWGGPFVMNTRDEVVEAYEDFQSGRMGSIPPEIVRA
ncbi:MAG: pirin family protein [Myxococcota bacterium]